LFTTRENGASLERETEPLAVKDHDSVECTDGNHIAQEIRKVNL